MTISSDNSARCQQLIAKLDLQPHPEGGFFRETYRAAESAPQRSLPDRFAGNRSYCTAIYFLLRGGDFSAFHRIKSDEMWHFYEGSPLAIHHIEKGKLVTTILGCIDNAVPQLVVPAGCWFAAEPVNKDAYALVGCTVAPGFDFADFELADRAAISREFPPLKAIINRLTRA